MADDDVKTAIDDMIDEQISANGEELPHASEPDKAKDGKASATASGDKDAPKGDKAPQEGQAPQGDDKASASGAASTGDKPKQEQQGDNSGAPNAKPLLDPRTGEIIAEGGYARRVYERDAPFKLFEYERRVVPELQRQLNEATQAVNAFKEAQQSITKLDLTPQQLLTGAEIVARMRKDPVATVKQLLTEVQSMGYDVTEVQAGGLSAAAIQKMVNDAVAPLVQDRNAAREGDKAYTEAKTYVDSFFAANEDAVPHVNVLHNMIANGSAVDLKDAFQQLRLYCYEQQLDIRKPLREQLLARHGGDGQNGHAPQQPPANNNASTQPDNKTSLPMGRASGASVDTFDTMGSVKEKISGDDLSNRDIVKAAMRAHGHNV